MKHILRLALFLIVTIAFTVTVVAAKPAAVPTPQPKDGSARVEYVLPYPGMLPDNPLYFLKNLRDNVIEMLISDPINKAEFYILQADKKLNMGITLSGTGKKEEAQEVLAQALAARTQAVTILETTAQSGNKAPGFILEKLTLSLEKHKEVLNDLQLDVKTVNTLLIKAQQMLQNSK